MHISSIEFSSLSDVANLDGIRIKAFDPNELVAGDKSYNPKTRNYFRYLYRKFGPASLSRIPPILVYREEHDYDFTPFVLDGNHRAEAAFFYQKPILGIIIERQEDVKACKRYMTDLSLPKYIYPDISTSLWCLLGSKYLDIEEIKEEVQKRLAEQNIPGCDFRTYGQFTEIRYQRNPLSMGMYMR
jgi:hypothetical protein